MPHFKFNPFEIIGDFWISWPNVHLCLHLTQGGVNVSQGIMGARWKPVRVVFDKRKCWNQEWFLYRRWIFNVMLSAGCFCIIYEKEIPKTKCFFKIILERFFPTIAGNSYVNRQKKITGYQLLTRTPLDHQLLGHKIHMAFTNFSLRKFFK